MGTSNKGMFIGAVIVILAVIVGFYIGGNSLTAVKPIPEDQVALPETCDSTTTPSLDINAYDAENPGTAMTEATNLWRYEGQSAWNTWTQGTAFDVANGKTIEVVMGITTSDFTDNAYGQYFTYKIPCTENPSFDKAVTNDEIETELTATFYNADSNAAAETFSAGETQTVSIKLKAGTDQSFGNPYLADSTPNVICLSLNATEWDKPEQVYYAGGDLAKVGEPQRNTAGTGFDAWCYEAPVVSDRNLEIFFDLNADDSNAPSVDGVAYIYAANYYINAETSEVEYGVENEEGTAVGTDAADSVALDFTA